MSISVYLWSLVTRSMFQISSLVVWGSSTARRTLSAWSWSLLTPAVAAMNLDSLETNERAISVGQ